MQEHGIDRYRKVQIETASPGQLVVMMYEATARFLVRAADLMNDSRYEDSEYWAGRANEVVYELMGSLDFQLGRDIASTLSATYTMTIREILRAQIRKEPDILNKLGLLYADLAKGWQEAVSRQAV